MKKVLVTQRIDFIESYGEMRDSIDQNLLQWLIQAKYLPIPIPNKLGPLKDFEQKQNQPLLNNWLSIIKPDALILSGGNDIGEYISRDETEKFLLDWAKKNKIPALGICRGMQVMTVWAGGSLKRIDNHVGVRHRLNIYGSEEDWPKEVNCFHNWGIHECPNDFEIKAQSSDGVIKAIKHKNLPWEGWMWHPERESPFIEQDINRLKALFDHE